MARDRIFGVCSEQGPRAGQENDYIASCSLDGTPWAVSPTDLALGGLLGEYATGVGEANLAFSAITYGASAVGCYAGWIR